MNIFKRLFRKKEISTTTSLSNIQDIVKLPSKRAYLDTKYKKELLKKCEETYKNILLQNKTLVSIDLSLDDLEDKLLMNIELLKKTIFDNYDNDINNHDKSNVKSLIQYGKMNEYWLRTCKLECEVLIRIYALKDLLKNLKVLASNNKRGTIENELTNLHFAYYNLNVQKTIIQNKMVAIGSDVKNNSKLLSEEDLKEKERLFSEITSFSSKIIPDKLELANKNSTSEFALISYLECELETYVYLNQNVVDTFNQELAELCTTKKAEKRKNKDIFLERVKTLETKLLLYKKYSNLVDEEIFERLYNLKFDLLTLDYLAHPLELIDLLKDNGFLNYKEIVRKKVESILMGLNFNFIGSFYNVKQATKSFSKYMKTSDNIYNYYEILTNKEKLGLLLALDGKFKIRDYFELTMVKSINYAYLINKYQGLVEFEDEVPLATIMQLMDIEGVSYTELHELYKRYFRVIDTNRIRIPEGIKSINLFNNGAYFRKNDSILKACKMYKDMNNYSTIYMPDSLKKLDCGVFHLVNFSNLFLYEGLEEFDINTDVTYEGNASLELLFKCISVPSTLTRQSICNILYIIEKYHIKELYISNFRENPLLNDKRLLKQLICIIYNKKTEQTNHVTVGKNVTKKKQIKSTYFSKLSISLVDEEHIKDEITIDTTFIKYADEDEIDEFPDIEIDFIYESIRKSILEQTGHNIRKSEIIK